MLGILDLKFPVVRDRQGTLARKMGATVTPEAFVVDANGHVRYHGRIDDQFAEREVRNANPSGNELKDAIAALLKGDGGEGGSRASRWLPDSRGQDPSTRPPTARTSSSILQQNCQECHRKGQVGPFALETFEQARKRADDIAAVAEDRSMPPWKAARHVGSSSSTTDRSPLRTSPPSRLGRGRRSRGQSRHSYRRPGNSRLTGPSEGGPDLILDIGADFAGPGRRQRHLSLLRSADQACPKTCTFRRSSIGQATGRSFITCWPTSIQKVEARKKDAADPGPGYACFSGPEVEIHGDLGGWAPATSPASCMMGSAASCPGMPMCHPGSLSPRAASPRSTARGSAYGSPAARFARLCTGTSPPNPEMKLPDRRHEHRESRPPGPFPSIVVAHAVVPHMHLLGKDMLMTVTFPGRPHSRPDQDRRLGLQLAILVLSGDSRSNCPRARWSRSSPTTTTRQAIPATQTSPPRRLRWGEATTDEMCIGFIGVTKKGQDLTRPGEKDDLIEIFKKQIDKLPQ